MFCPRCGSHSDDNTWKCEQCGIELHSRDESQYVSQYASQNNHTYTYRAETSSKAIWSLVIGIFSPCGTSRPIVIPVAE